MIMRARGLRQSNDSLTAPADCSAFVRQPPARARVGAAVMCFGPPLMVAAIVGALVACERGRPPQEGEERRPVDATASGRRWGIQVSGAGIGLILSDATGEVLRIACLRDPAEMTVVAERFSAVGSEERLSLGVNDEPFVFVADPTLERPSGVAAEGPIREDLLARLEQAREVSAVYGAQSLGPYAAPDPELIQRFVATCRQFLSGV